MAEQQKPAPASALDSVPKPQTQKLFDDQQLIPAINDFLQKYKPEDSKNTPDILNGRYKIDPSKPLSNLDTKNAHAFAATDLMDSNKQLFALVCDPASLQRHHAINLIKSVEHPNFLMLCDAGRVELSQSQQERFVLFYKRPAGKKLSEILANTKGTLNESFISRNILAPIISAMGQMSELGTHHGSIRPENIFYDKYPILGDCLSEPCGTSQTFYFEPVDRIQALPNAKGEGGIAQDYYAVAVLTVYLLYGPDHFAGYTPETLSLRILRDGAYVALLRGKEPPETLNDFLRGLLSGNVNERWDYRNLKQWIEGKRSNIMLPSVPPETSRPFEFCGHSINTKREMAHLLFKNWDKSIELMRTDKLIYWTSTAMRNKELSESLKRAKEIIDSTADEKETEINEQMMRIITSFDPNGPIRIKKLSFHLDGIDSLWSSLFNNKSQDDLNILKKFIEYTMFTYWLDLQRETEDYSLPEPINKISMKLDHIRLFVRNTGYGFGVERVLYELNPHLPCQSPVFSNEYIDSLASLLKHLDRQAPKLKDQDPIDLHIAAFLGHRLNLLHDVKLHELVPHPSLATNRGMLALQLIATAQQRCNGLRLPGLTHWLALRILPALDAIQSKTLRAKVKTIMVERAKTGYAQNMSEVLIHSNYAVADVSGIRRAKNLYQQNIQRIKYYKEPEIIEQQSAIVGNNIANIFAYIIFFVMLYKVWVSL